MHLEMSRVTLYLALWGAIGPLVGIIAGHYLMRSNERCAGSSRKLHNSSYFAALRRGVIVPSIR
jgi:hypothetical protein